MVFKCKACAAVLDKADLDMATGIATCQHCRAVMSFAKELQKPEPSYTPPQVEPARKNKGPVGRPEKLSIEDSPTRLRISWRWFKPHHFFLLFFAIAWNAFLVGWYVMGSQMPGPAAMKLIFFVFPIVHVAVGVGIGYSAITGFLNRTTVEVRSHQLRIYHSPLPWKGGRDLRRDQVQQLFVRDKVRATKQGSFQVYELKARLTDGRNITLIPAETEIDKLLYLEQQIEKRLGISDEAMPGEA